MSDDHLLIRVASHANGVVHPPEHLEHYDLFISQAMLEEAQEQDARGNSVGRLFLQLMGAVDFAGQQKKPVILMGRKQAGLQSGFCLSVTVPVGNQPVKNPYANGSGNGPAVH